MNRIIAAAILAALASFGCIQNIYAQSLPITLTIAWDPNPVTDGVTGYEVTLDNEAPIAAVGTSASVVVNSEGHHFVHVVAVNVIVICDIPSQCSSGVIVKSPPADVGFTLHAAPVRPTGSVITKAGP